MSEHALLDGKKILIVDDEADILDMLEELLEMCDVVKASTFEEAKKPVGFRAFWTWPFWISWVLTVMVFWRLPTKRAYPL